MLALASILRNWELIVEGPAVPAELLRRTSYFPLEAPNTGQFAEPGAIIRAEVRVRFCTQLWRNARIVGYYMRS